MDFKDSPSSYEDVRKRRLEENKKRMQELGLRDLSTSLSNGLTSSKMSASRPARPAKARVPKQIAFLELRRSTRVANNLQPNYCAKNSQPHYREVEIDRPKRRKRARFVNLAGSRSYSRSNLAARKRACDATRMKAACKAEMLMKALPSNNASFVKHMLLSHVTGGFWLGLPAEFSRSHLPEKEDMIVLENEKGEEWETVYLANKTGLSGGWRGFSLDHGLVDGDALVFELVETHRFKVYIVRAAESETNLEEENQIHGVTDKKKQDAGEIAFKRKQRLIQDKLYADVGTNSDEQHAIVSKKKNKKKTQILQEFNKCGLEEAEGGIRKCSQKLFYQAKSKASNTEQNRVEREEDGISRKRNKESEEDGISRKRNKEGDEIQDLFVDDQIIRTKEVSKNITCFLRSKKPLSSLLDGAPKKATLLSGDAIEVN